jgi:hypothetical protein
MPDKKLTDEWLKEIREKISCPQFGNEHYGEWGILTLNQRRTIKRLLDFIEAQEAYINRLQVENEGVEITVNSYKKMYEDIQHLEMKVNKIKAEAYKEFAERFIEVDGYNNHIFDDCASILIDKEYVKGRDEKSKEVRTTVDNLLKELVGDK